MESAMTTANPTSPIPSEPQAGQDHSFLKIGLMFAADLASSLIFAGLYATTHSAYIATGVALAIGIGQIGWNLARRSPIDAMQWMSLGLVIVLGGASLLTHDPRFVMVKPTLIYVVVGSAMLQRGWMVRYMPPEVRTWAPSLPVIFGYIWAAMMFATAAMNLVLARSGNATLWAVWLAVFPVASKLGLFGVQYLITSAIVRHRMRAA
jgi:intracellular septation protein